MRTSLLLAAFASLVLGAACCAEPAPHPAPPAHTPPAEHTAPAHTPPPAHTGSGPACRLPAPKVSQDACSTDADCGPSEPCHAKECVARVKSKPRTAGIMCTEILECGTADANHCGCFEGHCALIPPR